MEHAWGAGVVEPAVSLGLGRRQLLNEKTPLIQRQTALLRRLQRAAQHLWMREPLSTRHAVAVDAWRAVLERLLTSTLGDR